MALAVGCLKPRLSEAPVLAQMWEILGGRSCLTSHILMDDGGGLQGATADVSAPRVQKSTQIYIRRIHARAHARTRTRRFFWRRAGMCWCMSHVHARARQRAHTQQAVYACFRGCVVAWWVCVCVRAFVRACVRSCVRSCVRPCVRACVCVCACACACFCVRVLLCARAAVCAAVCARGLASSRAAARSLSSREMAASREMRACACVRVRLCVRAAVCACCYVRVLLCA